MKVFEGIKLYEVHCWPFTRYECAVTLPGLGIFLSPGLTKDTQLLRHEFGHILQRRHFGWFFYWFIISPVSLWSCCRCMFGRGFHHIDTWTEWSANRLSYAYFGKPAVWDKRNFPLGTKARRMATSFPFGRQRNA